MTKQSQAEQPAAGEMSAELLLRSWNKTLETVTECQRINKESGVRDYEQFTQFDEEPMSIKKYNYWIDACINSRNNRPYSLESLISSGVISEEDRQLYPPEFEIGRELLSMSRVQTADKKEWLTKFERWVGINGKSGASYTITVDNLDYYKKITPEYTTVPIDPTRRGAKEVRIAKIGRTLPWYEGIRKTYFTPFTRENIEAAMRDARKPTIDPTITDTTLYLVRDGVTSISSVPDFETWITGDFDTMFDSRLNQNQNAKLDMKELVAQLQKQSNATSESAGQYQ
jgi:hypothetical protein